MVAFDLATNAGWALWRDGRLDGSGVVRLGKKGDSWSRLRAAADWLPGILDPVAWGRGSVAFEQPLTFARGKSAASMFAAHELKTALLLACLSRGISPELISSYAVSTIKKHATGDGRASKPQVVGAMRDRWGLPRLTDDNEADALAVLSLHLSRAA